MMHIQIEKDEGLDIMIINLRLDYEDVVRCRQYAYSNENKQLAEIINKQIQQVQAAQRRLTGYNRKFDNLGDFRNNSNLHGHKK